MLVQKARKEAVSALGDLAKGIDVNARKRREIIEQATERAKKGLTLQCVWDEYITNCNKKAPKPTTVIDLKAATAKLKKSAIWKRPLPEIMAKDLEAEFNRLCTTANKKKATRG